MGLLVANNATDELDTGINAAATSFDVTSGNGADFPAADGSGAYFYCTLADDAGAWEIVKCTNRSSDTFTVTRNVDSSTGAAQAWSAADIVSCRPCASVISDILDGSAGLTGTSEGTFQIDNDNSGPKLKNDSGDLQVRNSGDSAFLNIEVLDPTTAQHAVTKTYLETHYGKIASGTKMFFYENTAPTGWTIDTAPADSLLSIKGGSQDYNVNGGQTGGSWTQDDHTHTGPSHTHTGPSHTHSGPSHTHSGPSHNHKWYNFN